MRVSIAAKTAAKEAIIVIPAYAGIHFSTRYWIPACAGMTKSESPVINSLADLQSRHATRDVVNSTSAVPV
jgi:hypothetical protein